MITTSAVHDNGRGQLCVFQKRIQCLECRGLVRVLLVPLAHIKVDEKALAEHSVVGTAAMPIKRIQGDENVVVLAIQIPYRLYQSFNIVLKYVYDPTCLGDAGRTIGTLRWQNFFVKMFQHISQR